MSFTYLIYYRSAMQYVANCSTTVPDLYTAVTLLKLLTCLADKSEEIVLTRKLGTENYIFMSAKSSEIWLLFL